MALPDSTFPTDDGATLADLRRIPMRGLQLSVSFQDVLRLQHLGGAISHGTAANDEIDGVVMKIMRTN